MRSLGALRGKKPASARYQSLKATITNCSIGAWQSSKQAFTDAPASISRARSASWIGERHPLPRSSTRSRLIGQLGLKASARARGRDRAVNFTSLNRAGSPSADIHDTFSLSPGPLRAPLPVQIRTCRVLRPIRMWIRGEVYRAHPFDESHAAGANSSRVCGREASPSSISRPDRRIARRLFAHARSALKTVPSSRSPNRSAEVDLSCLRARSG